MASLSFSAPSVPAKTTDGEQHASAREGAAAAAVVEGGSVSLSAVAAAASAPLVLQAAALPPTTSSTVTHDPSIPSVSAAAVLGESETLPEGTPQVKGHDFNSTPNSSSDNDLLSSLLSSYATMGFQATNLSRAINEIHRMRSWRLSDVPVPCGNPQHDAITDPAVRSQIRAKVFFAYTSNQISCGQRDIIRYLVQHSMVDVIVTTAGGIEEDLIKCFHPTYVGTFQHRGKELRKRGINRIGNLLLPNSSYCKFEDWFSPILNAMHDEQDEEWRKAASAAAEDDDDNKVRFCWTPSKVIERLGHEINDPESVLYWAAKNSIPIFCPALTDGSIGDMMYFHSYKRAGFILDIGQDIRRINDEAVQSYATGMVILGGGVVKHHTCNANLMRNGADYAVFVNTAQEFDGSDAGAAPDEAVSWGKIRITAEPVKLYAEASLVFPLIVSQTFAKDVGAWKASVVGTKCWLSDDEDEAAEKTS